MDDLDVFKCFKIEKLESFTFVANIFQELSLKKIRIKQVKYNAQTKLYSDKRIISI